jgi:ABC-type antimicrobial peptide transport system permease subunit
VLKKLKSMGYEAISALRVSVSAYNYNNLMARNTAIYIALIVLLIISILEILIVRSIMKIRNKDFIVLGSIGMNHRTIKLMNLFEMYIYSAIAILAVIIAANGMSLFRVNYIVYMIKYFNAFTYSIYIILNLIAITITVWLFNRYLRRKQKWSRYD